MTTDTPQLKQYEIDTLRLVARGLSNNAIARAQNVAVDTVKSRIHKLHKLLGTMTAPSEGDVLGRVLLVVWAYEHGLVEGQPSVSPAFRDACIGIWRSILNDEPRGDLKQWAKEGLRTVGVDQPNRNRFKPAA